MPVKQKFSFTINEETGCFECTDRFIDVYGYPRTKIKGVSCQAAKFIYEKAVGRIQDGHVIRHKCDNPLCINPLHLQTGTQAENIADRENCGRGVRPVRWKIDPATMIPVKAIKYLKRGYYEDSFIAERFGISESDVRFAKSVLSDGGGREI